MSRSASPSSASSRVSPDRDDGAAQAARDAFSIFAAARDAGSAPALRTADREYTFADLAALTRERLSSLAVDPAARVPLPVTGTNSVDTVVTIYALLEHGVAALMLHPRLTGHERARLLALAEAAGPLECVDAAAVMYTSGTTGTPRAAVLSRSALLAAARANEANLAWEDGDCWLLCMPLAHVGGLSILTRCLAARRCVALAQGFDVPGFPELVVRQRVTIASLVPTMLARVLDAHPGWRAAPPLRAILLGGAAASPALLRRAGERGLPLLTSYGMTETCAQVCATGYDERFNLAGLGSGRPLPGVRVRVVEGRIQVAGPMMMHGYRGEPALVPGEWFDTGDLGEIDEGGRLHVHARRNDLIITGGENVYPLEVEHVLEQCPGVAAAAVFGLPDDTWGQTVAALLVAEGVPPADGVISTWVVERLARHKRPRAIAWVDHLPLTPGNKLDRPVLAASAARLHALAGV